ncbi:hypothetical protein [Burkholderia mayonis]|uniref:hypothetical protein n=1 Tax=Burkholderia mayonis TaxID=1385591 RepID=UPI00131F411F|nr:hypothetical protein [Burkholderia mayonis]
MHDEASGNHLPIERVPGRIAARARLAAKSTQWQFQAGAGALNDTYPTALRLPESRILRRNRKFRVQLCEAGRLPHKDIVTIGTVRRHGEAAINARPPAP